MKGIIQYITPSVNRLLNWTPPQCVGRSFTELIADSHRSEYRKILRDLAPDKESKSRKEFLIRSATGDEIWMDTTISLVPESNTSYYIVSVLRDVSLQHKAQEEINAALEREKDLNQLKSNFIQIVSHEFRTPMTGISASNRFLQEFGTKLPLKKAQQHYENINRSLRRMNRLLDDVLFVSRDESIQMPFKPEPIKVIEHTEQLVEETLAAYPGRKITIESNQKNDLSCELDPNLLQHIFHNLLGNALKYSKDHTVVELLLDIDKSKKLLQWRVRDQGIGIPTEDFHTLFEVFRRGRNASGHQGTGMGLHIAKRSVELHGGSIHFESILGEGSEFFITIPLCRANSSRS
jgi:hypothetical protein